MKTYIKGRFKSIGHSLRGLKLLLRTEPNAAIHLLATLAVAAAGVLFRLPAPSWVLLAIAMALVWMAEALRACLNFVVAIYYAVIFERNEANFAAIVGHYDEKFNEVVAKKNDNKANE